MAITFKGEYLKELRHQHGLSQERLAEISKLSPRTIQRLEGGGTASLRAIKALSTTFDVSFLSLAEPPGRLGKSALETLVRRVTPLTVLKDIVSTIDQYCAMGFSLVETGETGCVGLKAGNSYMILATAKFMEGDYKQSSVARLLGQTTPYIYVSSVAATKDRLPATASIMEQVHTSFGTVEALVADGDRLMILVEKVAA